MIFFLNVFLRVKCRKQISYLHHTCALINIFVLRLTITRSSWCTTSTSSEGSGGSAPSSARRSTSISAKFQLRSVETNKIFSNPSQFIKKNSCQTYLIIVKHYTYACYVAKHTLIYGIRVPTLNYRCRPPPPLPILPIIGSLGPKYLLGSKSKQNLYVLLRFWIFYNFWFLGVHCLIFSICTQKHNSKSPTALRHVSF